jgi:hypothetical protein
VHCKNFAIWIAALPTPELAPSGKKNQRHAGGLVEIEPVGNCDDVYGGDGNQLAVAAVHRVSQHGKFVALVLQAGGALWAMIAKVHRSE